MNACPDTNLSANRKSFPRIRIRIWLEPYRRSLTVMALAAGVAPDRRGIEFQIVAARMNACPSRNVLAAAAEKELTFAQILGRARVLLVPIDPLLSSSRAGGSLRGKP